MKSVGGEEFHKKVSSGHLSTAKKARQRKMLEALAEGLTTEKAAMAAGISPATYYDWRRNDKAFAADADFARGQAVGVVKEASAYDGSFISFRKQFFGYDTYWHQAQMVAAIENAPPMGVTLVLLPPEHGKTTTVHDWITYKLSNDPNHRITYVSEGIGHARKAIGRIQRRLTDANAFGGLIARFGPFRSEQTLDSKPWTADYFTVAKATHDEQDYSMEARGWKSAIAGTRVDTMIVDDIQSRKSLNLTADMIEVFQQDFITRPGKEGRIIVIGTRVGVGDFYEKLIDSGLVDCLVELPAIAHDAELVACEKGTDCDVPLFAEEIDAENLTRMHRATLCPQLWDPHSLAKRRHQVSEVVWWRNYQQSPRQAGDATFTEAMTEACKDQMRGIGPSANLGQASVLLSLDPALGGGNSLTAAAVTDTHLHVLDQSTRYGLTQTEQILDEIERFARQYRPVRVVIEAVAFQRGLANDERLTKLGREWGFSVYPHMTGLNKIDESLGVASMDSSFNLREISIPWGDEIAQQRMAGLLEELHNWRPNVPTKKLRQDRVMSLWFLWLEWMRMRPNLGVKEQSWGRAGIKNPIGLMSALGRTA